jgi:hypothetical protein
MAILKAGDRVLLSGREAAPPDMKSGLFYNHFRGLAGTVRKVYRDGEVAVEIEPDTLPEDVWKRHMDARDRMRDQWLKSLPDDVRRKLTPEQKEFALRYVVLAAAQDVIKRRGKR